MASRRRLSSKRYVPIRVVIYLREEVTFEVVLNANSRNPQFPPKSTRVWNHVTTPRYSVGGSNRRVNQVRRTVFVIHNLQRTMEHQYIYLSKFPTGVVRSLLVIQTPLQVSRVSRVLSGVFFLPFLTSFVFPFSSVHPSKPLDLPRTP